MKILWFCNIMLPQVARHLSLAEDSTGGWLVGLSESLLKNTDIELFIAFPMSRTRTLLSGKTGNLTYFGFPQKKTNSDKYNKKTEAYAGDIILRINPDVVHIFGTEFPHTLAVINACEKFGISSKAVISIQGMVSVYAGHYYAGLPNTVIYRCTLRDFIKRDNIRLGRKSFEKRGKYEIEAIKKICHISGRTDWDKACTSQINPKVKYHFCNETLRNEFYNHNWDINKCEKHSLFISQAGYPIKGLHFVLEALPKIIEKFPDTHLYVAGGDITRSASSPARRLMIDSYGVYIRHLIYKHQLTNHITFTGVLDEKAMCTGYLKTHVFISASSIENSPNSLGEAMLLGVPSVASDVGGVSNLLTHGSEGYIYQHDAPYMLAHYVCNLFGNDKLAVHFSQQARSHALNTHDKEKNALNMVEIYKAIAVS